MIQCWSRTILLLSLAAAGCGGGDKRPASDKPAEPVRPAEEQRAPAEPAGSATLSGNVTFDGKVPEMKPIAMSADPGCAAKHKEPAVSETLVLGAGNKLANVLVRIKSGLPSRQWSPPSEPVVMDQEGCRYKPHVMGIMVGQTFRILNSDGLLHNVHALPQSNKEFNMAMPASRTEADEKFTRPEDPFKIKCDVHPWMNAFVAVLEHPFFAVTGTDGSFSIPELPAGTYEVEAWHERLGTRTSSVTLADGEAKGVDFAFAVSGG